MYVPKRYNKKVEPTGEVLFLYTVCDSTTTQDLIRHNDCMCYF